MTRGPHGRDARPAVLGAAALLCALAGCAPAAAHGTAQESRGHSFSIPTPFQIPAPRIPARVVVIGDSLSTGYGMSPAEAWPSLLSQELQPGQRPVEITNAAKNGAGYIAAGEGGETFKTQIAATVDASTDIVVLFGSDNDADQDPSDLRSAIEDALAESKALAPRAARIIIGPLTAFGPTEADLDGIRDQEKSAARDAGAEFVDPILEHWIPDPESPLLGPDGEHPSSQGQQFLKARIQGILTSLENSGTAPSLKKLDLASSPSPRSSPV